MLKKGILGTLFVGLIAILIAGAVNRTVAKTADRNVEQETAGGNRWAQAQDGYQLVSDQPRGGSGGGQGASGGGQGRQGQNSAGLPETTERRGGGQGQNSAGLVESTENRGGGQGRQGQNSATQAPWLTIQGTVVTVDETGMTVQTADGEIEVADRAWRFAQESGFSAQVGDRVQLQAYYDGDVLETGDIANLSTQQQIQVREETSRPLWAGGSGNAQTQDRPGNRQSSVPVAETEDHDWQTMEGVVVSIDQGQMTVRTAAGDIQVIDRPWDYAQSAGFTAQKGDAVSMTGFYEDGTFEVGTLAAGDMLVQIREESGRPMWAGGGRWR